MTPEERAGFASAINEAIAQECAFIRTECQSAVATVRLDVQTVTRSLEQRCAQAESRADQLQRELDAARALAAQPPISAALMDSDGVLHLVQRNGERLTVPIADLQRVVAAAVSDAISEAEQRMGARLDTQVARALQLLGNAPAWDRGAFYGPGALVSCYIGRTYELRAGIKASLGQEPGEYPETWERIGTQGLRVMKARPATLERGDIFTEGDSRFIHDGENTTLLVPRAPKDSDIERRVKPVQSEVRALAEFAGSIRRDLDGMRALQQQVDELASENRATRAWITTDGGDAVVRSAQTQAWCENRALLIDSPALARIVDRADEIDTLLDQGDG